MIGMHLLGGVGDLLSRMTGAVDSEMSSSCCLLFLAKLWIRIGQHGMGVMIPGDCCSSGMPSVDSVGLVVTVGAACGTSIRRSSL